MVNGAEPTTRRVAPPTPQTLKMSTPLATAAFDQLKRESLRKLRDTEDKSPKGSVDAPILDMIRLINDHPNYVTSSSCSGRIAVFRGVPAGGAAASADAPGSTAASTSDHLITKGGKWLLAEHDHVTSEQLRAALAPVAAEDGDAEEASNMVMFKHEPFIMHVVCRDVDAAKELLQCGIACGFRESGVVLGNKKIMCAIRTTANAMEIPLGRTTDALLVSDAYLTWLLEIANEKFEANRKKTDQLCAAFRKRLVDAAPAAAASPVSTVHGAGTPTRVKRSPSTVSLRRCRALPITENHGRLLQRGGHSSVQYDGSVYIFAGQGQAASGTTSRLADLVVVSSDGDDHSSTAVETAGEPPSARMHHSAVVVGDRMVVFGGRAGPLKCFNDVHAFDLVSKTWAEVTVGGEKTPAARWKHSCSVVGTTMYVYGGRDASQVFNDLHALDLAAAEPAWQKIECSEVPAARFDHVGVSIPATKQLFVWGGLASLDETSSADAGRRDVFWLFDTVAQIWEKRIIKNAEQGPTAGLFGAAACAVDGGAHVVVCGGTSAASSTESSKNAPQKIYSLSTSTMEWQLLGAIDNSNSNASDHHARAALVYSTGTWLPARNELLVIGGGFQVFGFGHCYSSSFACELVIVHKDGSSNHAQGVNSARAASSAEHDGGESPPPSESNSASIAAFDVKLDVSQPLGVLAEKKQVKAVKTLLEATNVYDKSRRVHVVPDRQIGDSPAFLLPVTPDIAAARTLSAELQALVIVVDDDAYGNKFGKAAGSNRNDVVRFTIEDFAKRYALPTSIIAAIPERYEFVSDVLLVARGSFVEPEWAPFAAQMWAAVCQATTPRLSRVARKEFIDAGEKRQSHVELLYVNTTAIQSSRPSQRGWVEVRENGITYGWDLTKVMFSSGNVTEKARMGAIGCAGDVIVDLFCGIGYYVVPFLVHGGAAFVHACEWNPDSVDALRFNLARNHVAHKCKIYEGDNQLSAPTIGAVADRVNLGLLPTSEKAWPLAAQVLKPSGGWMHVHDNVAVENRETWEQHVVTSIQALGEQFGKRWRVTCEHVERVKSYAPKVHHLVADVRCVPVADE